MNTPVTGTPRVLLRIEGLIFLTGAVLGYAALHASWLLFALLFLIPDVALVAYLAGPRVGALAYNAAHTYVAPGVLAVLAYLGVVPGAWPICLVWVAHIGMDRMLGLGLKFPSAFQDTHLGVVGRAVPTA
jgi:hypothetical protein